MKSMDKHQAFYKKKKANLVFLCLLYTIVLSVVCMAAHASSVQSPPPGFRYVTVDDLAPAFRAALLAHAPWDEKNIEISKIEAHPKKSKLPEGKLSFDIDPPLNGRYLGKVSFRFILKIDDIVRKRIRVCGQVEVYRPVVCASGTFNRGHILQTDDLRLARRPLSRLRGQVLEAQAQAVGLALKRSVKAGQILTEKMLEPPVVIRRGDRITILAKSPYITVCVPGEAREEGSSGALIRVKNLMSKREIVAKVLDSETAMVRF